MHPAQPLSDANLVLGRVDSMSNHQIRKPFDAEVKVIINTHDMIEFGQSVSKEFLNLYQSGCLNPQELDQIREKRSD